MPLLQDKKTFPAPVLEIIPPEMKSFPEITFMEGGQYVMILPDQGILSFGRFRKGSKTISQILVTRDGEITLRISKEEAPWFSNKDWDNAPKKLRIAESLWSFFRLEVKKVIDKREKEEAEEREKRRLAREESHKLAELEFQKKKVEFEEKKRQRDEYLKVEHTPEELEAFFKANPDLKDVPIEPVRSLSEEEAEKTLYGISHADLSETRMTEDGPETVPTEKQSAKAVLEKMNLRSRKGADGKEIYVLTPKGNLWTPDGLREIERVIDTVLPSSIATKRFQEEVKRRVVNEVLEEANEDDSVDFEKFHGLIGLQGGLVADLWTGKVRERTPEDLILKSMVIPVHYDPLATCPNIEAWMKDTLDIPSSIDTTLDFLVSCADRRPWKAILINVGSRDSGKSVFKKLIEAFFGSKTTQAMGIDEITRRQFALARLRDKQVAFIAEAESRRNREGDKIPLPIDALKRLSGDDLIGGEKKFIQDTLQFTPFAAIEIDSNRPPLFDSDNAFVERLRPVTYPFTFVNAGDLAKHQGDLQYKLADPNIKDKLTTKSELSGLLNLILKRSPALMKTKFVSRDESAFSRFEGQTNSIKEFYEKYLIPVEANPANVIYSSILLEFYQAYCKIQLNIKPSESAKFFRYIADRSMEGSKMVGPSGKRLAGYDCFRFDEESFNRDQARYMVEAAKTKSRG